MKEGAVIKYGMDKQIQVTPEQLDLVKKTIFPGSSDDEFKLFLFECQRRGVHPLDRKIHPIKRKVSQDSNETRVSFQASIDLMRSEAEATRLYAGQDDPIFGAEQGGGFPESATVVVYKWMVAPDETFQRIAVPATARWKEYYPGERLGHMWRKMPYLMLSKCAEALALRKAFPQQLSGLYTEEEMARPSDGADANSVSGSVKSLPQPEPKAQPEKERTAGGLGASSGKTVNDTLHDELASYCGNDEGAMAAVLKQISYFKDKKQEEKWITLESLAKASNAWAGKSLAELRKLAAAKDNVPAGCSKDPKGCDHSSYSESANGEMVAYCKDGQKCRF